MYSADGLLLNTAYNDTRDACISNGYNVQLVAPVGVDDNGNTIDIKIGSDGVTYEGDTYNYNSDNSVIINGDTYYIIVDPSSVDDDYYQDFLGDTINNYKLL